MEPAGDAANGWSPLTVSFLFQGVLGPDDLQVPRVAVPLAGADPIVVSEVLADLYAATKEERA